MKGTPIFSATLLGSLAAGILAASPLQAAANDLPDATSPAFCQAAQEILANTEVQATVTLFDDMPEYRHSKPSPDPLMIYQVVTYDDKRPIVVSCKVKAADHLRDVYGEAAAGEQQTCPAVTRLMLDQAIRELEAEYPEEAAATARAFIIDDLEPYATGQSYLSDFELSYRDPESNIHIQSPGLQTDWDNLLMWILPNRVRGQTYCHLPTIPYLKALATGAIEAGTLITTADDAPTKPPQ
jgi:hypothetical protein